MNKNIKRILLSLVLLAVVFVVPGARAINTGDTVNYTSAGRFAEGKARIFTIQDSGGAYTGACAEAGIPALESGTAKVTKIANDSAMGRVAYYLYQNHNPYNLSNSNKYNSSVSDTTYAMLAENLMQIAGQGKSQFESGATSAMGYTSTVVQWAFDAYDSIFPTTVAGPNGFEVFYAEAGNNQNFTVWRMKPFEATKSYASNTAAGKANASVKVGDVITYQIKWENSNGSVKIVDTLSSGLEYVAGSSNKGEPSISGNKLTWNNISGETGTLTYKVKVTDAAKGLKVCNGAVASSGGTDKTLTKLCNPVPTKSYGGTSLSDNKGWDHHEVLMPDGDKGRAGDDIKYKVTLPNVKTEAVNVVVTDVLSKGLTFNNDAAVSGGTLASTNSQTNSETKATTAVFTVTVPANGTATLTYSAKVNADAVNIVKNNAKAKYGNDPVVDIGSLPNPVPRKQYDVDTANGMNGKIVQTGDIITYNISYANPYTEKATVNLRDTLSKGLSYEKGTAKVCDHNKENCKTLEEAGVKETVTVLNDGKTQILWTRTNMASQKAEIIVYDVEVEGEVIKVQNDFDIKTCRTTESTSKTETVAECKEQPNPNCKPNCTGTNPDGSTDKNCKEATDEECTKSKQECTFTDTVCNKTWMDIEELKNPKPEKMYNEKTPAGYNHAAVSERDRIRYEIRYENVYEKAIDIKIKDTISKGIEFIKSSFKVNNDAIPANDIAFTNNNKTFTWTDKNVEPNKTRSLTYEVIVTGETTKVKNKACIEFSNNPGYERCLKELENPVPQKTYAKDTPAGANGAQVKKGDTIRYSIKYSNSKDVASSVVIMDNLSKGIEYIPGTAKVNGKKLDPVSATKDSNGQMLVWMKEIAAGAEEELTYDVKVTGETKFVINNASIQYDNDPVIQLDRLQNPLVENPSLINIPNTASVITITGIVLGISLIGGGSYLIYRRYKKA